MRTPDVAFRLADLADDVDQRRGPRPASSVCKLAARRYFAVVGAELSRMPLSLSMVEQLSAGFYGVVVQDPLRLPEFGLRLGLPSAVTNVLYRLTPGALYALYDALERLWVLDVLAGELPEQRARRAGFTLK